MATRNRFQGLNDVEVVEIAQRGSLEARDELARRFRGAVLLVAGQIAGSREIAEDVAQEVFLLAFRQIAQLQAPAKFPAWLYAITRRRALRMARREGRSAAVPSETLECLMAQEGPQELGPLDALLYAETQEALQSALTDLSPEIRLVLHLFYYEQWTAARIAAFLSLPLTTIKWRLRVGRQRLRGFLTAFLEENHCVQFRLQRDRPPSQTAGENRGTGGTHRADREF